MLTSLGDCFSDILSPVFLSYEARYIKGKCFVYYTYLY